MRRVKHARLPAAGTLFAAALLAAVYALTSGWRDASPALATASGQEAGGPAAATRYGSSARALLAHADQLRAEGSFGPAADAYCRVLDEEPYNREARFWTAICLAGAGDEARLEAFMDQLALSEAKLAVELFQRSELAPFADSPKMAALLEQARDQAKD
jgi:alkyl sulfatase BDS1-like metallo-beta-lactamase superfamily hydrolase